jgi:hypothetical protein
MIPESVASTQNSLSSSLFGRDEQDDHDLHHIDTPPIRESADAPAIAAFVSAGLFRLLISTAQAYRVHGEALRLKFDLHFASRIPTSITT